MKIKTRIFQNLLQLCLHTKRIDYFMQLRVDEQVLLITWNLRLKK